MKITKESGNLMKKSKPTEFTTIIKKEIREDNKSGNKVTQKSKLFNKVTKTEPRTHSSN